MFRFLASILLIPLLTGCAISPPSSLFASLSQDEQAQKPKPEPQEPKRREAGVGSSISSLWASVKSGLSFGDDSQDVALDTTPPGELDPVQAQKLINSYRAQKGLKPLRLNAQLAEAAALHSRDLSKNDRISHYGSDGSDTWDRVRRTGYQARLTAENVGTGQQTLGEVFRGWQKSPTHNANLLLPDAEEMGIALVNDPNTQFKTFWTLVVGSPVVAN